METGKTGRGDILSSLLHDRIRAALQLRRDTERRIAELEQIEPQLVAQLRQTEIQLIAARTMLAELRALVEQADMASTTIEPPTPPDSTAG